MNASTHQRDDLMPKSADGISRGMAMAAVVHVGLLIALTLGVSWKASEPEGVEAELWAAVPQIAAQRDIAPEPTPKPTPKAEPKPEPKPEPKVERPDPQIAIEKAKQEKLKKKQEEDKREREEKEKLEKKKALDAKAKAEAEQKKIDDARKQNLARIKDMMGEPGGSPGGKAAQTAGPSASWAGRVSARVKPNFVYTEPISGDPTVEVELKLSPDGTIIGRKIVKGSGDSRLDDAILRAIDKTETLPRDTDGTVPSSVVTVFRPKALAPS